jgi:hypothetical protein
MRNIVRIRFGSHLYGTSTPASDLDFKSVYIPDARSILLQRVTGSISTKREKAEGEKNVAGEVDEESFSLQKYLALLSEGQTVATDVLFAPDWSMTDEPSWEWREIVENRDRLITSKSASFVGYCRQQANKYGIKGSRVAAARAALAILSDAVAKYGTAVKLAEISDQIEHAMLTTEHMDIIPILTPAGVPIAHWEVCGRKLPYTSTIKSAHAIVKAIVDNYGHRALQAEAQQGVDWKALSHAVRVANQAVELLLTGNVTFPLSNATHILAIKRGEIPYQEVAEEIEAGLIAVEDASARSKLRATPDHEWIDNFVAESYRDAVLAGQ